MSVTWKIVDNRPLQETGTYWSKTGNRNLMLRQELLQHGNWKCMNLLRHARMQNKDDNKQIKDNKNDCDGIFGKSVWYGVQDKPWTGITFQP
jgi:hypothetical protein